MSAKHANDHTCFSLIMIGKDINETGITEVY